MKLRSNCPVSYTLEIFGDKWTLLIIRDMMFLGKKHFRQLLNSYENIAPNTLSNRLKRLEESNIIEIVEGPDNRSTHGYELTENGLSLAPIIIEMTLWGSEFLEENIVPDSLLKKMRQNKKKVISAVQNRDPF